MAFGKLWQIAYRDLGRNRRRSFFTLMAVALGLALLIFINGFIAGVMHDAVENNIRLKTGHVQVLPRRTKLSTVAGPDRQRRGTGGPGAPCRR